MFSQAPAALNCIILILGLFVAAPTSLRAQSLAVGGIHSGILFDRATQSLRPMLGLPGSAHLGDPVVEQVVLAAVAPDGMTALAVQQDGVSLFNFRSEPPARLQLHDAIRSVDRIVWVRDSSAAVLYSSSGRHLQWLRNVNAAGSLDPAIDLSSIPGRLSLLAVDSNARLAVISSSDEDNGGQLYLVTSTSGARFLVNIGDPKAATFGTGDLLYVADGRTHQVLEIEAGTESSVQIRSRFTEQDGVTDPVALSFSPDGNRLYLANGSSRTLMGYDLSGHVPALRIELEVSPTELEPLPGGRFLLNPGSSHDRSFWLLHSRTNPEVMFVPAERPGAH